MSNCFTTWFGLGMSFVGGTAGFRVLYGLQLIPGVLMLVGSLWMPESPRWLALMNRYDECLAVLKKVHGDEDSANNSFYAREFHQIQAQIELERSERLGISDIITKPSYRKRVLLIMAFYFFQQ